MKSSALVMALFLGIAEASTLRQFFAGGVAAEDDTDMRLGASRAGENFRVVASPYGSYTQPRGSFVQVASLAAAKAGSGVRAKWVELPDCPAGKAAPDMVPLEADLANASIATCKAFDKNAKAPAPPKKDPPKPEDAKKDPKAAKGFPVFDKVNERRIYDPVIHQ